MRAAMGQFAVSSEWQENIVTCRDLMQRARAGGADLLVLPEAVLMQDRDHPDRILQAAQPLDGPFVSALLAESAENSLTTIMSVHVPAAAGKTQNMLIALRSGRVIARYAKLHLYDAFAMQESQRVTPGSSIPPLIEVAGMKVGLMTCYDIRFPELARRLALDGADVLVLPAAWVRGPQKERHWALLTATRALENTCYLVATGECGPRNIGNSMTIDPLGVTIAQAAESAALIFADLERERLAYARRILPVLENRRFATPQLRQE